MVRPSSGQLRSSMAMALVLLTGMSGLLPLLSTDSDGYTSKDRSGLVRIDVSSVMYDYSPWGSVFFGEVNRSTELSFRLMNYNGAPFSGIRVNLTLYWFDGVRTDRSRVMHSDSKLTDIGAGVGTRSDVMTFSWVPRFAGSYMWNLSVFVPGDRFPVSDTLYGFGKNYTTGASSKPIWNGFWVGTYYSNCSDMGGWTSESQGGRKDTRWHVSSHELAKGNPTLHSPDKALWVGNETTGLAPDNGTYSLISPDLDLARFDDSPYSLEFNEGVPQIYFMYKYRGSISPAGPAGAGGLFHFISTDGGETWEKLKDPLGRHVNITGTTVSPLWDFTNHTSILGGSVRYGLDLSKYQGSHVMLKIEYHPSGLEETGFLIDDIILVGKEKVDTSAFTVDDRSPDGPSVEPGSNVTFWTQVSPTGREEGVSVRAEVVEVPTYLKGAEHVFVDPPMFVLNGEPVRIDITVIVPKGSPSGPGWITLRLAGASTIRDVVFHFNVKEVHDLRIGLEGALEGPILPGEENTVYVVMRNDGNTGETVHLRFVSEHGLEWDQGQSKAYNLAAGNTVRARIGISTQLTKAGTMTGHMIWSRSSIDGTADDILQRIEDGGYPAEWTVTALEYEIWRVADISLFSAVQTAAISDPPDDGEKDVIFNINVLNRGNSEENVTISSVLDEPEVNITLDHPGSVLIGPGVLDKIVQVRATISFPINQGTYGFRIEASVPGGDGGEYGSLDLSIRIGPEEIVNGIFIRNDSVTIAPEDPIMGSESVISFDAYAFGLPDNAPFHALLQESGEVVSRSEFLTTRIGHTLCQIKWVPDQVGLVTIMLLLEDQGTVKEPPAGLVSSLNLTGDVRHVDISLEWMDEPANATDPGPHYFEVKVTNEGNARADQITVILHVASGNETQSYPMNVSGLDPKGSTRLIFGPVDLKAGAVYQMTVRSPDGGRWDDSDMTDNDLFTDPITVGESPPGEPIWRSTAFMVIAGSGFVILSIVLFVALYRRR